MYWHYGSLGVTVELSEIWDVCVRTRVPIPNYGDPPRQFLKNRHYSTVEARYTASTALIEADILLPTEQLHLYQLDL
jgi:hypothetical protein